MIFKCTNKKNPLVIHRCRNDYLRCRFDQVPKWLELTRNMFNAVGLLDAPTDSVIDNGIIYKLICLIFFMVKVYYLVSTSFLAHLAFRPCELFAITFHLSSVNISHCNLLLKNHRANCNQTLVEWSLHGPLPKLCPVIPISNQDGLLANK